MDRPENLGFGCDRVSPTLFFERTNGMSRGTPNFYPGRKTNVDFSFIARHLLIRKVPEQKPKQYCSSFHIPTRRNNNII